MRTHPFLHLYTWLFLTAGITPLALAPPNALAGALATAAPLTLAQAIQTAWTQNPELAALEANAQAEHAAIRLSYAPENPMLGLGYEQNMTLLEMSQGAMRTWSITQDLKFPTKYLTQGSAQKARAQQADEEVAAKKLEIRSRVITAYFQLFSLQKSQELLQSNLDRAQKTSRTAESRHATGLVPQQDEMKAHAEETRINAELLVMQEEAESARAELLALTGNTQNDGILLPQTGLTTPKILATVSLSSELSLTRARHIRHFESLVQEAENKKSLALQGFLPDFRVSYRHALGDTAMNAYSFSIEASIPLWFPLRQSAEVSQARALQAQAEYSLARTQSETRSQLKSLKLKTLNHQTLLRIYETTLIPQALSTFNSSETAYRAGKITLIELLDSQRALFQTRILFYRTLAEFADSLSHLETTLGESISDLP